MSDFLKSVADAIEAETPAPKMLEEGKETEIEKVTVEQVSDMITKALQGNDVKMKSLVEEAIEKNLEKLANYKPEEKPEEPKKED